MSRRSLWGIAALITMATLALMLYSLDRTAWIFMLYETGRPNAQLLGYIAAVVMELAVVGLIASEGAADALPIDAESRRVLRSWAARGLVMVLATQAVANLVVGFLRGAAALREALLAAGPDEGWQYHALGGVIWLLANGLIPALIFGFSKMQARIFRLLIATQPATATAATSAVAASEVTSASVEVGRQPLPAHISPFVVPIYRRILELLDDDPALPTHWLAEQLKRSERTARARLSEMVRMGMLHEVDGRYVRSDSPLLASVESIAQN